MRNQGFTNVEIGADVLNDSEEALAALNDASPTTKLERRRRIEDLFEEKRLREELGDFDLC